MNIGVKTGAILALLLLAGTPHPAMALEAQTLGDMTNNLYDSLISLQVFLSLVSYMLGVFFSVTGLQMLRAYVDDPGRNPATGALLRLGAAAFFIFAPTAATMLVHSLGVTGEGVSGQVLTDSANTYVTSQTDATGDGAEGLDGALLRFVADFGGPFLDNLLPIFSYLVGVIFMLIGLKRLALANGEGPQAPGGLGTISTFVIAASMMAFGYIMYVMQGSIFGVTELYTNQAFAGADAADVMTIRAGKAMYGVFIFLRIVGYISVLRGLFMLRSLTEGSQQVTLLAVGTHMIAGSLLANAGAFVNALQYTFIADEASFVFTKI